jgi:hypothetical protein
MACPYWWRISPCAFNLFGHEMMNGSVVAPRNVSFFQRRKGVLPACAQPPGVVVVRLGAPELVQVLEVVRQVLGLEVEEVVLVEAADRSALRARAVVGDEQDHRVVELVDALEVVEDPPELCVGVADESGEHLHHPRVELLLVVRQRTPLRHVGIAGRDHRFLGEDAELLLVGEHRFAVLVPTHVEHTLVLVGLLFENVVWCVAGSRAEVHEERLVRRDHVGVADEADRLVGQILREVVAVIWSSRRAHGMVVVREIRVPLIGLAGQEPVVAVEASPQRPCVERPCHRLLSRHAEVPLAERERVVTLLRQDLGHEPVLEGHPAVVARVPGRPFADRAHRVRVVVAAGHDAGTGRRAEPGGVEVGVLETLVGHALQVRCVHETAVRRQLTEPNVVQHVEQHVRRTISSLLRGRPRLGRVVDRLADLARERRPRAVLGDLVSHFDPLLVLGARPAVGIDRVRLCECSQGRCSPHSQFRHAGRARGTADRRAVASRPMVAARERTRNGAAMK